MNGQVGCGGPGNHVAGILDVAWRIGDDELAARGGKVTVSDVDGDTLLAFGTQTIGQQSQIQVGVAALPAGPLDSRHLVFENGFAVQQQPADQGAFAIIHTAGGGKA